MPLAGAVLLVLALAPLAVADHRPRYSGDFEQRVLPNAFGQAPSWSPSGRRIVDQKDLTGDWQIYTSRLDGSERFCVTCRAGSPPPPNMVAQYRPPEGDKLLFHSWNGKQITLGAPGFGGVGAEVFVANRDGSDPVNLTKTGEGEDNYHAYFSPNGKKLVWTHLDCNFVTQNGRCMMEILLANYVDDEDGPHLEKIRVARPENGHYYETQLWAPDGSGFLYTESVDNSLNLELFFYRLRDGKITRLTRNPAWDEQATFTPDMKRIIFMSTRDHPGFFNTYRNLVDALGVGAESDFLTILPVFELAFLQPIAQEATDLYELNLKTKAVRRLTHNGDDGWIIPEFMWDPNSGRLLWTEARYPDGIRVPLPLDPVKDARELIEYIQGGPPPPSFGTEGLTPLPLERRTLLGRYR